MSRQYLLKSLSVYLHLASSLVLLITITVCPAPAVADYSPYSINIQPQENDQILRPHLVKALRQNRDNLKLSGMDIAASKLVRKEQGILAKVLESEGFYQHHINYEEQGNEIVYAIDTGPASRINSITIESPVDDIHIPDATELGLVKDNRLRAADVLAARETMNQFIRDHNCLWQITISYEVLLDQQTRYANIFFRVKESEQVSLADISVNGLITLDESYVRNKLGLKINQCYRNKDIEIARLRLLQSGLFARVDSRISPPVDGKVNITFDLEERHHKTVKVGVGYSTDESVSLTAGWQHRNFLGSAEHLDIEGKVSKLFKSLESTLALPSFRSPKQILLLEGELADENLEAYDARGLTFTTTLKRKVTQYLTASAGIQYKFRSVQENNDKGTFGLVSLPASIEYDRRDNLLDPRHGWVATAKIQPYVDSLNTDIHFVKSTIGASVYYTLPELRFAPTLAARLVTGSINGIGTDSIPADVRFYSGGGGSVRGYPFQKLGPIINDDPNGGRSLLELSLETRLRFTENWGGVLFIDGGNTYDEQIPNFNHNLQWAVGIGARYITALAPIRVDIAFPVNGRKGIDNTFEFYVSLAQAF